jgi:hypothetical protein
MPYLMTTDDTKIGCVGGEALTPLMLSFEAVTTPPDELAVLVHMVGGGCASNRAMDFELDFLRLSKAQEITAAQDVRIQSRRWHGIAAERYYKGYQALIRAMGEPGDKCPNFANDQQEFVWMIGTVVGLQAMLADAQGGSTVGVPRDIVGKATRGAGCLDTKEGNQKWWGLPKAMRATLWTILPGDMPPGTDPWQVLAEATKIGELEGVRLADALMAIAAFTASNTQLTKDVIRKHAESKKRIASSREYRLIDMMATEIITALSDRLWTEAVGHRTPISGLGTFWDDQTQTEMLNLDINVDDFL